MTASLLLSFVAGILTVAAPCVLPLLPVIVGGSMVADGDTRRARWRPFVIAASLAVSVVVFTIILKASTALLGIPPQVWQIISGVIIIVLGVDMLFPAIWDRISSAMRLQARSTAALDRSVERQSVLGDIMTGAALGPVFSSCSPTYALILVAVLPASFGEGLVYIGAYAIGLAGMLLLVALLGRALVRRLGWLANPNGWFRRVVGALFVLVGIAIIVGFDKQLQTWILDAGWYDPIAGIEEFFGGGTG